MPYSLANQTPSTGHIAWTSVGIAFDGTVHQVANGSTSRRFVWWRLAQPTVLQTGDVNPTLAAGDALVFINDGGVGISVLDSAAVHGGLIVEGTIAARAIAAGAISARHISAGAIEADAIAAYAINAEHLTVNAIQAQHITAGAIEADAIAAGAITADKIAARSITAGLIAAAAITATELAAGAITAAKLAAGAVTAAAILAGTITATQIAANTITASEIAAGAITATELAANSVVAGKIQAGAISATEISAGAIVASKLAIGDTSNVYPDPDFLDDSLYSGPFVFSANTWGASKRVLSISDAGGTVNKDVTGPAFPVEAGRSYLVNAKVGVQGSGAYADAAQLHILWYSDLAATALISSATLITNSSTAGRTTVQGGQTVAPSNALRARLLFRRLAHPSSTIGVNFNEVVIRRAAGGELIVDGAITATKIQAASITGDRLAANTITATQIAANTITAAEIAAGAITADELAGNSVVAGKIQAGAISATEIAAGAIVASRLAVGDTTNIYPDPALADPDFYSSPSGSGAYSIVGSDFDAYGTRRLVIAPNAAVREVFTDWFEVSPVTAYWAEVGLGRSTGTVGTITAEVEWGSVSSAGVISPLSRATVGSANGTPVRPAVAVTSPANTGRARFVFTRAAGGDGNVNFGKPELRRRANANLIVDGAITTDKLSANAVTAAKIAAGTITATEIATGTITAAEIAAGTITAAELAAGSVTATQISTGAVVAGKIAANAVTADTIAANSVVAGKVAAGAISAAEISAGAIVASKLAVSDTTNLYPDPNLLDPASYSSASGAGAYGFAGTGVSEMGTRRAQIFPNAAARVVETAWIEVSPGTSYLVEATIGRIDGGTTGSITAEVEFGSLDSAGVVTSTGKTALGSQSTSGVSRPSITLTSGATARRARFVFTRAAGGDANVTFGKPEIRRRANASLVVDGAITTDKLSANAVTAAKIAAGTITATELAANSVTATQLAANAVTAGKINAGAVQADQIGAMAIVASKIAIADTGNICLNPNFSFGELASTDGWSTNPSSLVTAVAGTSTGVPAGAPGAFVGRVAVPAANQVDLRVNSGTELDVTPGETFLIDFWAAPSTDCNGAFTAAFRTTGAEGGNTHLGVGATVQPASAAGWRRYTVTLTVPATAGLANFPVVRGFFYFRVVANATPLGAWFFSNVRIRRSANAELIVDGAITADKLSANAVTAAKIAAGSVTTSKLAVGSSNQIFNSCLTNDTEGWNFPSYGALPAGAVIEFGSSRSRGLQDWAPPDVGGGFIRIAMNSGFVLPTTAGMFAEFYHRGGTIGTVNAFGSTCVPGRRYHFSALVGVHRCNVQLTMVWLNASGGVIQQDYGSLYTGPKLGGLYDDSFEYLSVLFNAPANARWVRPCLVMSGKGTAQGAPDAYVFFTKTMFGESPATATEAPNWQPGGVTDISGGQIRARTVSADRMMANSITSNELAANSVTAGKIAAGAINANEIAAGVIKSTMLASDFVLTNTAQIGNAIITNAKIGNLEVGTHNIQNTAITEYQFANWDGDLTSPVNQFPTWLLCSISIATSIGGGFHLTAVTNGKGYTDGFLEAGWRMIVRINGTDVSNRTVTGGSLVYARSIFLGAGTHTFEIYAQRHQNGSAAIAEGGRVQNANLAVIFLKK
jgi:hypothetical protein